MKKCLTATFALALSLGFAGSVYATEPDTSDIEYQRLKDGIAHLKQEIGTLQADNKEIAKNEIKNTKAIKVSGDMRIKWIDQHAGKHTTLTQSLKLRTKYSISKDLAFNMNFNFMADNPFGTTGRNTAGNNDFSSGDERYDDFNAADQVSITHLNVKKSKFMGQNSLTLGRMGHNLGATKYWSDETGGYFDGVKVGFGPKENVTVAYGNWAAVDTYSKYWNNLATTMVEKHKDLEKAYLISARQSLGDKTTLYGWMLNEVEGEGRDNYEMRGIGIKTKLTQDISLAADFNKNLDQKADGIFARFKYKGVSRHVPGSYTLGLDYMRIEPGNIYSTQLNGVNSVSMASRDAIGLDTAVIWGEYMFRKNVKLSLFQSIGRKAVCDSGVYKKGDSAPAYTRAHMVWYF